MDITFDIKTTPITDDYDISNSNVLGVGVNGKVVECIHRRTGFKYALKILIDNPKSRREIHIQTKATGCRHIVDVIDVYHNTYGSHTCFLVIMEWFVTAYL